MFRVWHCWWKVLHDSSRFLVLKVCYEISHVRIQHRWSLRQSLHICHVSVIKKENLCLVNAFTKHMYVCVWARMLLLVSLIIYFQTIIFKKEIILKTKKCKNSKQFQSIIFKKEFILKTMKRNNSKRLNMTSNYFTAFLGIVYHESSTRYYVTTKIPLGINTNGVFLVYVIKIWK